MHHTGAETMTVEESNRRIKTDKRDARNTAKCLRNHTYSAVHIPTEEDRSRNTSE